MKLLKTCNQRHVTPMDNVPVTEVGGGTSATLKPAVLAVAKTANVMSRHDPFSLLEIPASHLFQFERNHQPNQTAA